MKVYRWPMIALAIFGFFLLLAVPAPAAAQEETSADVAWEAAYWNNTSLSGSPTLRRVEAMIDYRWGFESPSALIGRDRFSARWTTVLDLEPGTYQFDTVSDDGIRVWVDDRLVIDNWTIHARTEDRAFVPITVGPHEIVVEYFENTGLAQVSVTWERLTVLGDERVTVAPLSGPPGTPILVAARGFRQNTDLTIGLGREDEEPAVALDGETDANGGLRLTMVIPAGVAHAGERWVATAVAAETGERATSAAFTVTAGQVGLCGEAYMVMPGDWLAKIARQCGTTIEALLATNPWIVDPNELNPGQILLLPPVIVPAAVRVVPDQGAPGSDVQVLIEGFPPLEEIQIGFSRGGAPPAEVVRVETDDAGRAAVTVSVPVEAQPGEVWSVVVAAGSSEARSEPFTVLGSNVTATTFYNLNLRPVPDIDAETLAVIPVETEVPVIGRNADGRWLLVVYNGETGWIAGWLTLVEGDLDGVPIVGS